MKRRRALSLVLSLLLAAALAVPSLAAGAPAGDTADLYPLSPEDLAYIQLTLSQEMEVYPENAKKEYSVGSYIPSYQWDGSSFVLNHEAHQYPVYSEGDIVYFYTKILPLSGSGSEFGQFSPEFSAEVLVTLNQVLDGSTEGFFFVTCDGKTFVVADGKSTLLTDYSAYLEAPASTYSSASSGLIDLQEDELDQYLAESGASFYTNQDQENSDDLEDVTPLYTSIPAEDSARRLDLVMKTARLLNQIALSLG